MNRPPPLPTDSEADPRDLFAAFVHPLRLRILHLVLRDELCVCDLCEVLDESQPKVSQQLAILRHAGLVRVRQEGRWRYYAADRRGSLLARRLLGCVGSCLGDLPELARDRERLDHLSESSRCA